MALLSLQKIHKTFEKGQSMKITSYVVWILTSNKEILSLLSEKWCW